MEAAGAADYGSAATRGLRSLLLPCLPSRRSPLHARAEARAGCRGNSTVAGAVQRTRRSAEPPGILVETGADTMIAIARDTRPIEWPTVRHASPRRPCRCHQPTEHPWLWLLDGWLVFAGGSGRLAALMGLGCHSPLRASLRLEPIDLEIISFGFDLQLREVRLCDRLSVERCQVGDHEPIGALPGSVGDLDGELCIVNRHGPARVVAIVQQVEVRAVHGDYRLLRRSYATQRRGGWQHGPIFVRRDEGRKERVPHREQEGYGQDRRHGARVKVETRPESFPTQAGEHRQRRQNQQIVIVQFIELQRQQHDQQAPVASQIQ